MQAASNNFTRNKVPELATCLAWRDDSARCGNVAFHTAKCLIFFIEQLRVVTLVGANSINAIILMFDECM